MKVDSKKSDTPEFTCRWVTLSGPAQSGKDTLASVLVNDYGWTRIAFADPLKEMALAIDPWIPDPVDPLLWYRLSDLVNQVGWELSKKHYPEVRRFLQKLGTDAVRTHTPDYWVDIAVQRATEAGTSVVFTDARFPNECQAIRERGGFNIAIESDVKLDGENAAHVSENALKNWKFDSIFKNPHTTQPEVITNRFAFWARLVINMKGPLREW